MATPAELQAKIERERLELVALRNRARDLPDGPERDAILAQRDAVRAQQRTTTRELEVATSQSPATGQFEGVDANSGEYRYKNPVTGTSFLSPTAPTSEQQQQSGISAPTPAATPLPTEAQPETAPAEVQTPATAPQFVNVISPADQPPAVDPELPQTSAGAGRGFVNPPLVQPAPQQIETFNEGQRTITTVTDAPTPVQVPVEQSLSDGEELVNTSAPAPVDTTVDPGNGSSYNPTSSTPSANSFSAGAGTFEGGEEAYLAQRAREQQAIQARFNQPSNGDWRLRLRLAPGSNYLYNSEDPGILAPLKTSDGVIFPYTPSIQTSYNADYEVTDLTHSNYRGQFYKSSNVGDISITGIFTAQDTAEAEYMLAVIHFFRSVTKMFYGQDAQRGAPPPLVYLIGLGQFQFNNHPCVVKSFSYNLPTDVDYIRTQPNNYGINLLNRRTKPKSAPSNTIGSVTGRLSNARDLLGNLLKPGALSGLGRNRPGQPGVAQQAVNNTSDATYVPTKIDIQITLLPIQTRNQVSQQFSLESFANGSLLRGGFW